MKQEMSESTKRKQSLVESVAEAEESLSGTKKSLAEDTKYLKDLKRDCQFAANDYEIEYKDNKAELGALAKAKAIMLKKFAFLQVNTAAQAHSFSRAKALDDVEDSKARALRSIEQLGRRFKSS